MRLLKVTEEYRVDSEIEAKELMEQIRGEAAEKGYSVGACGYTYKEKKIRNEVVDEAWLIKAVKIYGGIWL